MTVPIIGDPRKTVNPQDMGADALGGARRVYNWWSVAKVAGITIAAATVLGALVTLFGQVPDRTIAIGWDAVDHEDLGGYRVFAGCFGADPACRLPDGSTCAIDPDLCDSLDYPPDVTSVVLDALAGAKYSIGVKAVGLEGFESIDMSDTLTGYSLHNGKHCCLPRVLGVRFEDRGGE